MTVNETDSLFDMGSAIILLRSDHSLREARRHVIIVTVVAKRLGKLALIEKRMISMSAPKN